MLVVALAVGGEALYAQGTWAAGYRHPLNGAPLPWPQTSTPTNFEAVNMAVIPNSNNVIVWDLNGANQSLGTGNGSSWPQRWAVGNPETGSFTNYTLTMPPNMGDLFCSGHVWLPNGRLFVAGGNTRYPILNTPFDYFEGSEYAGIWNPQTNSWTHVAPMRLKRWYPTVTLIVDYAGDHRVMVSGGVQDTLPMNCQAVTDQAFNTYEVFDLGTNDWERDSTVLGNPPRLHGGPQNAPCFQVLGEYPRMHLLSTNQAFVAGMWSGSCRVRHDTFPVAQNGVGDWLEPWLGPYNIGMFRGYGSSVLLPNVGNTAGGDDLIMILGGGVGAPNHGAWDISEIIDGGAAVPVWGSDETMNSGRMCMNTVLLPNGDVLTVGGSSDYYFQFSPPNPTPFYHAEYYRKGLGWILDSPQQSPRMYHSTAALLPSGKVVSAGGDLRTSDYEVFSPVYTQGTRPKFAGIWSLPGASTLNWGQLHVIQHDPLAVGVTISRVVLMRPCSVTHHSDMDQRYVELDKVKMAPPAPAFSVQVRAPNAPTAGTARGSTEAPRGYYMMFLIDSNGVTSTAKWVLLP